MPKYLVAAIVDIPSDFMGDQTYHMPLDYRNAVAREIAERLATGGNGTGLQVVTCRVVARPINDRDVGYITEVSALGVASDPYGRIVK